MLSATMETMKMTMTMATTIVFRRLQVMSAGEKETRLEAILIDTTTLCGQIEANARELKVLLESGEDDGGVNARVFVLEQVRRRV